MKIGVSRPGPVRRPPRRPRRRPSSDASCACPCRRCRRLSALDDRDIGALFRLLRQHTGASQTRIGIAVGMPQSQVSLIMSTGPRRRQVTAHDVLTRIADGLRMPDQARRHLGLAPVIAPPDGPAETAAVRSPHRATADPSGDAGGSDAVRRRELFEQTGTAVLGAALAASSPRLAQLHPFAEALTQYPHPAGPAAPAHDIGSLTLAVTTAKRQYQSCQYTAVGTSLPALLVALDDAATNTDGDTRLRLHALAADAYHVAASVLLKLDDQGLAWLAADRSLRAATLADDPLALASSARILTHTLMSGGHLTRAKQLAADMAARLDATLPKATPDSLSVYGALLLRGSIAAANGDDRPTALTLLDEADQASQRLGDDANHRWTAFGPTNVLLHRVNIATTLGDAGQAVDHARRINLGQIPVVERRASFYVDVVRAFNQWGRYEHAYHAIRQAEEIAPEEVRSRPAVHRLVADLLVRSPHHIQPRLRTYADQLGILT
jgi:tetratricopeptide (TPR) repeat protein